MSGLRITGLAEEMASLARLPWSKPLEEWPEDESLTSMRGISRHVVRLVRAAPDAEEVYAVKETVPEFANREYTTLRELNARLAPSVEPVAVIDGRLNDAGEPLPTA